MRTENIRVEKIAIVGGGPAGIAAAVYLKRAGFDPLVIEKNGYEGLGGLVREANFVENYPGFPDSIPGEKLADLMREQMIKKGVRWMRGEVVDVRWDGEEGFFSLNIKRRERNRKMAEEVGPGGRSTVACEYLIVASGSRPKKIPVPVDTPAGMEPPLFYSVREAKVFLAKKGGRDVVIIGGGDVGFDYALNLDENDFRAVVLTRNRVRAIPLLVRRAREKGISVVEHAKVTLISVTERVAVEYERNEQNMLTGKKPEHLRCDCVLVACGREPDISFVPKNAPEDKLYIIGDARGGWRQIGIAVGDGIKCAMDIAHKHAEDDVMPWMK